MLYGCGLILRRGSRGELFELTIQSVRIRNSEKLENERVRVEERSNQKSFEDTIQVVKGVLSSLLERNILESSSIVLDRRLNRQPFHTARTKEPMNTFRLA